MLEVGQSAPDFNLASQEIPNISLSELRGQFVVLFFYPKDDTPGCTKEACAFQELSPEFADKNARIFGISADPVDSHQAFARKYGLKFPLLADPEHKVCEAYGVWGEREWQGKKFMGIARTTFVIDPEGKVARIYQNVQPEGHAEEVLAQLP